MRMVNQILKWRFHNRIRIIAVSHLFNNDVDCNAIPRGRRSLIL